MLIHLLIAKTALRSIGTTKNDNKFGVQFLIICFTVIYGVDSLFGSSSLQFKPNGKVNINFSQSIAVLYVKEAKIYLNKYLPVSKIENFENINNVESVTYRYLLRDSSKKQALIVIESWGLDNNVQERMEQIRPIILLNNSGYSVNLDSSLFYGGTSQAEVRELYKKSGDAYFSVIQHGISDIKGIVSIRKLLAIILLHYSPLVASIVMDIIFVKVPDLTKSKSSHFLRMDPQLITITTISL